MVALPRGANQPEPEPQPEQLAERSSEWLPPDWVESLLKDPSPSAEVVEIQPGVRWSPRESSPLVRLPENIPAAPRRFAWPRLRLPRIPRSPWIHRRQLQVAIAGALVLAAPLVIGKLDSGAGVGAPAAHSPFKPAPVAATVASAAHASATPRGTSGGRKPLALTGHSTGGAPAVRTAGTTPAGTGSAAGAGNRTTSTGGSTPGASNSSSPPPASTSQPAGSGTGNPGSGSGTPGGGSAGGGGPSAGGGSGGGGSTGGSAGGGSGSSSGGGGGATQGGSPPSQPSPVSQLQGVVSGAPQSVQGVASNAIK